MSAISAICRVMLATATILALGAGGTDVAIAQSAFNSSFDHVTTGWPLEGSHRSVDCASCHVGGIFQGTPRQCVACHSRAGLVKSTARQWGQRGVTVNWIAAAPRGLSPVFAKLPLPIKPDAVMVALGRPLDTQREIVPMIEFLGSPGGRAMTGATLMLDGGEWMVP